MEIALYARDNSSKDAIKVPRGRECEIYSNEFFKRLIAPPINVIDGCTHMLEGSMSHDNKIAWFSVRGIRKNDDE